jgi:hypothetical protein
MMTNPTPEATMPRPVDLLPALDALRNTRALVLMLGTLVMSAALLALARYASGSVHMLLGVLLGLLGALVFVYGVNGAGVLLMDQARGQGSRTVAGALLQSLVTTHRLILIAVLVGLVYLAGLLVLAVLLLACKLPGVGTVLFAIVLPVGALVLGAAALVLFCMMLPLAAPAIWDGGTVAQSLSRVVATLRTRPARVLAMVALLFLLVAGVALLAGLVVMGGMAVVGGLSGPILGVDLGGGMRDLVDALGGMAGVSSADGGGPSTSGINTDLLGPESSGAMGPAASSSPSSGSSMGSSEAGLAGGAGGYLLAAGIGGAAATVITAVLPALVLVGGYCRVYLANAADLDVAAANAALAARMAAIRDKAGELRTTRHPAPAPSARAEAPPPPAVATLTCSACQAACLPGERFCGTCGNILQARPPA